MQGWLGKQNKDSVTLKAAALILGQAQWNLAHTVIADSGTYEIVLLKNIIAVTFDNPAKAQQRYLVLQKQNGNIVNGYIYELFGDNDEIVLKANEAITGFSNKSITGFTGNIALYSWDNHISKSKTYVNGMSSTYSVLQPKPVVKKAVQTLKKVNEDCIDWYWCTYVDGCLESEEYLYTTCSSGNCYPNGLRDSKGVLRVKTNCGGGGGDGTGNAGDIATNADSVARFTSHIDSSALNPCFKRALYILSNVQPNCIGSTIDYFTHGSAPDYKWNMQMGSANGDNAVTTPHYNYSTQSVTTTFNSVNYSSGSDLAVARTILHESVHAYLVTYFGLDPNNAAIQYSDLVDNFYHVTYPNYDAAQHNVMVKDFISDIALVLNQYALSQGYNVNINYCTDLAWGGLTNTTAFNSLSQTDKDRIWDALNIEQNGTDRFGNPTTFKGTASGCH